MLGVPCNNFVRKYEHYCLLTHTLARIPLWIYVIFVKSELKLSQPRGRSGVKQLWWAKVEALLF